jgi:hypothetical protein
MLWKCAAFVVMVSVILLCSVGSTILSDRPVRLLFSDDDDYRMAVSHWLSTYSLEISSILHLLLRGILLLIWLIRHSDVIVLLFLFWYGILGIDYLLIWWWLTVTAFCSDHFYIWCSDDVSACSVHCWLGGMWGWVLWSISVEIILSEEWLFITTVFHCWVPHWCNGSMYSLVMSLLQYIRVRLLSSMTREAIFYSLNGKCGIQMWLCYTTKPLSLIQWLMQCTIEMAVIVMWKLLIVTI